MSLTMVGLGVGWGVAIRSVCILIASVIKCYQICSFIIKQKI